MAQTANRSMPNLTHFRRLLALSAVALVAAACGSGSANSTYEDPDERSLFSLPDGWHLYQGEELASLAEIPLTTSAGNLPVVSSVAFDGAPGRSVENLSASIAGAAYPIGSQVIRSVASAQRDLLSRQMLEEAVFSYGTLESSQEIVNEDFSFGDDYDGIRRFVGFIDGATSEQGAIYFVSVTDPSDSTIYTMAAGCSVACFEQYQNEIQEVVDSWLVNTNQ